MKLLTGGGSGQPVPPPGNTRGACRLAFTSSKRPVFRFLGPERARYNRRLLSGDSLRVRGLNMGGFRFSITSGLAAMTLLSIGLWAYVNQSDWAADITYSIFFCFLCLATCAAAILRDDRRPFWLGLAIFGWAYWFVGFDVSLTNTRNQLVTIWGYSGNQQPTTGPRLFTSDLLDLAEQHLTASRKVGAVVMAQWRGGGLYRGTITQITANGDFVVQWEDGSAPQVTAANQIFPLKTHSRVAGHSVLGSLFALAGGIAVATLFGAQKRKDGTSAPPS